jgi:hypothetical protein
MNDELGVGVGDAEFVGVGVGVAVGAGVGVGLGVGVGVAVGVGVGVAVCAGVGVGLGVAVGVAVGVGVGVAVGAGVGVGLGVAVGVAVGVGVGVGADVGTGVGAGVGAADDVTLSKVAVPTTPLLWLVTARPARTTVGSAIVWVEPATWVHDTPSAPVYAVKALPLRVIRSQRAGTPGTFVAWDVVAPAVFRHWVATPFVVVMRTA